jgi:hypothetical protein
MNYHCTLTPETQENIEHSTLLSHTVSRQKTLLRGASCNIEPKAIRVPTNHIPAGNRRRVQHAIYPGPISLFAFNMLYARPTGKRYHNAASRF